MPSIRELFSDPDLIEEGDDTEIDIDKVLGSVDSILNSRAEPAEEEPPGEPVVATDEPEEEVEEEPETVAPAPSSPPSDPFLLLPPERRAALLALDEAIMSDPDKRAAMFGVLSGTKPEAPPAQEPTLPEHIDPTSFEAQLWHKQVEQDRVLAQIADGQKAQTLSFEQQRANQSARQAGDAFSQKYADKLPQSDILEIAKIAGTTGIAAAFAGTVDGKRDPVAAFERSLEHVLWTNELFRSKVLGTDTPVIPPGELPEARDRKRKLRAVSSSASPVSGGSPVRPPVETGPDGRLSEKSRMQLVQELSGTLRAANERG